ncbi:MAG: RNA polymerase sigma factor [Planctomycetaceae bacterium]|nr:RNA polymerase sigma factor [Planctomycetales bacterium]MCB9923805.1 RNA polymerase sigma factor [Planctomycetaceae bacterium]
MALTQALFNEMVEAHGAALYRIAYRMVGKQHDAEDLVQEAFRSAWASRTRYRPDLGERAWLVTILRRRVVDGWRRQRARTVSFDETVLDYGVDGEDPAAREFEDHVQAALSQLPDQLRETLLLVVVGELTHQEVAEILEIPLGTVLSRVSRARTRLRKLLVEEEVRNQ